MISSSEKTNENNEQQQSEVTPLSPDQPKWEKVDGSWVWRTYYCTMTAKVVNENSHREFLIDIRHNYNRSTHAVALIPKEVIEDLYKEFTQYDVKEQELIGMRAELAQITAQLEKTRADLLAAMTQLDSCEVEVDDDEDSR